MSVRNLLRRENAWWYGIPCIAGLLTWLPYVILNAWNHVSWSIWRIPFVPIVLFDSSAYFEWIGPALSGYPAGNHIGLFVWIFRALGVVLPSSLSIAEVWLVSLWITVTLGTWAMASAIHTWSDLPVRSSRILACCASLSLVIPFMGRPGVFTWYVPFYLFALAAVWRMDRSLKENKPIIACMWAFGSLGSAWVYPYFFVHIVLWLAVIGVMYLHRRFKRLVELVGVVGVMGMPFIINFATPFLFTSPSARLALELQERMGLAFTRWPVVSNSLLLVILWGTLLAVLRYFSIEKPALQERSSVLLIGWVTLLGAWLSNVFTGAYIHNDHFRGPATLLAWVSLGLVYGVVQQKSEGFVPELRRAKKSYWLFLVMVAGILGISGVCSLWYMLDKGYVFTGDYLNVVHVSHWLTLAGAAALVLLHSRKKNLKGVWIGILLLSAGLGVSARAYLFQREAQAFSSYVPYVSTIDWVHEHVSGLQDVCTDTRTGEIIGSFSGRMTHPSFAAIALPKPDEEIVRQLQTQLGYYNADMTESGTALSFTMDSMRGATCAQFSFWSGLFSMIGGSRATFRETTGCPEDRIDHNQERMRTYLASRKKNEGLFRALCPIVIIRADQKSRWDLPREYRETKISEQFSAWKLP